MFLSLSSPDDVLIGQNSLEVSLQESQVYAVICVNTVVVFSRKTLYIDSVFCYGGFLENIYICMNILYMFIYLLGMIKI